LCEKAYAENKDENHDENNPIRLASSGFHKADSFVQPPKHSLIPRETDYYRRLIAKCQRVLSEGANRLLVLRAESTGEHFIARLAAMIFLLQIARAQD